MKEEIKELINVAINEGTFPTDDILSLFNLALALEKMQSNPESNVFGFDQSQISQLNENMKQYLAQNPGVFRNAEVYGSIWEIDGELMDTDLFFSTLDCYYQDVLADKNLDTLDFALALYDSGMPLSDEYLEDHPIPASSYDEFMESFNMIVNNPIQDQVIEYKKMELIDIIQRDYSDNPELMAWAEEQDPGIKVAAEEQQGILPNVLGGANMPWNTPKPGSKEGKPKSSNIKMISLIAVIILALILLVSGAVVFALILVAIWALIFYTPLGNLIPAIKNSKNQ